MLRELESRDVLNVSNISGWRFAIQHDTSFHVSTIKIISVVVKQFVNSTSTGKWHSLARTTCKKDNSHEILYSRVCFVLLSSSLNMYFISGIYP
jgi:hypothetical protein